MKSQAAFRISSGALCIVLGLCCTASSGGAAWAQGGGPAETEVRAVAESAAVLPDAPGMAGVQASGAAAPPLATNEDRPTVANLPLHILKDQVAVFSSPVHVRAHDLKWFVPLAAATGAALYTDHHTMQDVVSRDPVFNSRNQDVSNVLIGGMIATPVALFAVGHLRDDEHAREAGLLGGEAMADGAILEQIIKLVAWRERPYDDNGRGLFFTGHSGPDSSFISAHSTLAWSSAAVIAAEYPKPWVEGTVYTAATAVSLTRVLGQQHFPTDVLIGGAAGWLVGHYVYKARHHGVAR